MATDAAPLQLQLLLLLLSLLPIVQEWYID